MRTWDEEGAVDETMQAFPLTGECCWAWRPGLEYSQLVCKIGSQNLALPMDLGDLTTLHRLMLEWTGLALQPGQVEPLGLLFGRPLGLIVTAVCTDRGEKRLILRLHQGRHCFDSSLPAERVSAWTSQVAQHLSQTQPEPEVEGEVVDAQGPLRVRLGDGTERAFERLDAISFLWGASREYLQPPDLVAGTRVRVKPLDLYGGSAYLRAQVVKRRSAPEEGVCRAGQQLDEALMAGEVRASRLGCLALLSQLEGQGRVDSYVLAKLTLNVLLGYVLVGDKTSALTLWAARTGTASLDLGARLLESGPLTRDDLVLYKLICARLSAFDSDPQGGAEAMAGYMAAALGPLQKGDPINELALRNWYLLLVDLYGQETPPPEARALFQVMLARLKGPLVAKIVCYPAPAPWFIPATGSRPVSPAPLARPAEPAPAPPANRPPVRAESEVRASQPVARRTPRRSTVLGLAMLALILTMPLMVRRKPVGGFQLDPQRPFKLTVGRRPVDILTLTNDPPGAAAYVIMHTPECDPTKGQGPYCRHEGVMTEAQVSALAQFLQLQWKDASTSPPGRGYARVHTPKGSFMWYLSEEQLKTLRQAPALGETMRLNWPR